MKKFTLFAFGIIFGTFITSIMAYKYAERMAATKQKIRDDNRKRGIPVFWWGKGLGRLFIKPEEAAFAAKDDTYYQYPSKEELAQKPGQTNDEFYDKCFLNYIVFRNLTDLEAWDEARKDYPGILPKNISPDYNLQLNKTKKSFREAMRRRRNKLSNSK